MKLFLLSVTAVIVLSSSDCGKKKTSTVKYRGKLEIAALCMNYTIKLTEGTMDTSLVAAAWTDETTQRSYTDVFRLGNPCDFPASIKQGDEFYFVIDTAKGKNCAVCMAYYPTPPKALPIKVVE